MNFPFTEIGDIRVFSSSVQDEELQWHWDEQDRMVTPTHDSDWKFQYDNSLPIDLQENISLFVPAGTWHRLIKGSSDLSVHILKHDVTRTSVPHRI